MTHGIDSIHNSEQGPQDGLTKREYFAAMAMQGILSNSAESSVSTSFVLQELGLPKETKYVYEEHYTAYVAKVSCAFADALIKQLNS